MNPTLREILSELPEASVLSDNGATAALWDLPVRGLYYDSRNVTPGSIFFCLTGKTADGHAYATAAYRSGARIFVAERAVELPADALVIRVSDSRIALSVCAAAYYGHPEREIRLIGLTGTKGKTTTAMLTRTILEGAGISTGYIGTNGIQFAGKSFPTVNSTPESERIYHYLRAMRNDGMQACVLEVSSQALWMERTRGLVFDTVLFTNLSRDHIGGVEHPDFEHYRDSKRRLFTDYATQAVVVNRDDAHAAYMADGVCTPILDFGLRTQEGSPLWYADGLRPARRGDRIGVSFAVYRGGVPMGGDWFLPMSGDFNVQNALAALVVACERFGASPDGARESLAQATVRGRFENVISPALPGVTFVIDYAHNGVSLTAILDALAVYRPKRLICLFGSVGGRTTERRRDLAEAAGSRCDLCILTSDNPGSEPPEQVIDEIDAAFPAGSCPRVKITDRAEAIRYAVEIAQAGDIILLAGKGHEDYQLIGTRREPFSETTILLEAIEQIAAIEQTREAKMACSLVSP